jgi:hypothetical protein
MGALIHVKSNTIGDFTGTVTVPSSAGGTETKAATDLVRPSDWNSAHQFNQTVVGNTAGQSTVSGTNLVFGGSNGITLSQSTAAGVATIWAQGDRAVQTLYPYPPMSTVSQTLGAIGVSTASIWVFPYQVQEAVQYNAMRVHWSASLATTTVAASQTLVHQYGLYTQNGTNLSRLSSSSYSLALSQSSVSGTLSYPTSTGTGGYGYNTTTWTGTAQAQSLIGTVGQRIVDQQMGATGELRPGLYWLAQHQRQTTAGAAAGLSTAYIANAMFPWNNVAPIGISSGGQTTNASYGMRPFGVFTSTGSAGHSGTGLLDAMAYSGFANTISNVPLVGFMSTQ